MIRLLFFIALCAAGVAARVSQEELALGRGLGGQTGIVTCPLKPALLQYPSVPASYDLRQAWPQCITPILSQGSCGCCWAFAAAMTLTERFCIQSNNTVKRLLSPQDLVECDHTCQYPKFNRNCNSGCNGGYLDNAWTYLNQSGVVGWSCVPYEALDATCPATKCNTDLATKYYSQACYRLGTVLDIQADIILNGPVEAGFTVYDDFMTYTSGVYVHSSTATVLGGHAVRLVGWGTENGVDYWLAANQWSTGWGDQGYFKIKRGSNECGIESSVIAGLANLNALPTKEYEDYIASVYEIPPPTNAQTSTPGGQNQNNNTPEGLLRNNNSASGLAHSVAVCAVALIALMVPFL